MELNAKNMALFAALADSMKINAFKSIQQLDLFSQMIEMIQKEKRQTFIIHLGEELITYDEFEKDGVITKTVGDENNPYLNIIDHGTKLKGMVSVNISTITSFKDEGPAAEIVLEVYPLQFNDPPLMGTIWAENIDLSPNCPNIGNCLVFSAEQISVPSPMAPTASNNSLRGFSFGIVTWFPPEIADIDSRQIIGRFLGPIDIVTPMGLASDYIDQFPLLPPDQYPHYYSPRELRKTEIISPIQLNLLRILYAQGIKIFSLEGARQTFKDSPAGFTNEEINKFMRILCRRMDAWFDLRPYNKKTYLIPKPKLVTIIQ